MCFDLQDSDLGGIGNQSVSSSLGGLSHGQLVQITRQESNHVGQPNLDGHPAIIHLLLVQDAAPHVLAASRWALPVSPFGVNYFHVDYGKLMLYNRRCDDFGFTCDLPLQAEARRSCDENVLETRRCPPVRSLFQLFDYYMRC